MVTQITTKQEAIAYIQNLVAQGTCSISGQKEDVSRTYDETGSPTKFLAYSSLTFNFQGAASYDAIDDIRQAFDLIVVNDLQPKNFLLEYKTYNQIPDDLYAAAPSRRNIRSTSLGIHPATPIQSAAVTKFIASLVENDIPIRHVQNTAMQTRDQADRVGNYLLEKLKKIPTSMTMGRGKNQGALEIKLSLFSQEAPTATARHDMVKDGISALWCTLLEEYSGHKPIRSETKKDTIRNCAIVRVTDAIGSDITSDFARMLKERGVNFLGSEKLMRGKGA